MDGSVPTGPPSGLAHDRQQLAEVGPFAARADLRVVQGGASTPTRPVASRIQVSGSVSTTFGGVPRVCRGPSTHWTTANGGIRTSVDAPGAFTARASASSRVQAASAWRSYGTSRPGSASFRSSVWTTSSTVRVTRKSARVIAPKRVGISRVSGASPRRSSIRAVGAREERGGCALAASSRVPSAMAPDSVAVPERPVQEREFMLGRLRHLQPPGHRADRHREVRRQLPYGPVTEPGRAR